MREEKASYIVQQIEKLGIEIDLSGAYLLYDFYEMLIQRNEVMNLTAITKFEDVVSKHFVDSLSITYVKNLMDVDNLIDIGTGAGFPGIPLKIMFPHLKVTLLDSLRKRVDFLNYVMEKLGLTGIEAIHGRAEDYAKPGCKREQYDLCVSRAVANLSTLSEYCLPYVKIGGEFISYKSGEIEGEVRQAGKAVAVLGGKIVNIEKFVLPETDVSRSFVQIEKIKRTPKSYPRKAGTPSRAPIQ